MTTSDRSHAKLTRTTQKVSRRLTSLHCDVTDYYQDHPAVRHRLLATLNKAIQSLGPSEASALVSSTLGVVRFLQDTEQDGAFPDHLRKPGGIYNPRSVLLFARKELTRALAEVEPRSKRARRPLPNPLHSDNRSR